MRVEGCSGVAELNLGFLCLLREALIRDRLQARADYAMDERLASLILSFTPDQLIRLAQSELLLVGLRWNRHSVWSCLSDYALGADAALPRALIVAEASHNGQ